MDPIIEQYAEAMGITYDQAAAIYVYWQHGGP